MSTLYTTNTWHNKTVDTLTAAQSAHESSTNLGAASIDLKNNTFNQQDVALDNVHKAFDQKIQKTTELKEWLDRTLAATNAEIAALVAKTNALEALLKKKQSAYDWNSSMKELRFTRPARENTNDKTQYSLDQQGATLHQTITTLTKLINGALSDTQKLNKNRERLEKDLFEKNHALGLDHSAYGTGQGTAIQAHSAPGGTVGLTTIGTWIKTTEENVADAERSINNSIRLRQLSDQSADEALAAETNAMNTLKSELNGHMNTTMSLIVGLQNKIADNQAKIADAERVYSELNDALQAKYPALDLAKHRYTFRTGERPGKELMGDAVHQALRNEHATLDAAAESLLGRIKQVAGDLDKLHDMQSQLQADLADKQKHHEIDTMVMDSATNAYPAYTGVPGVGA